MAKAKVRGGAMAAEGVELSAADQDELRDTEGGGASGECTDVVPLGYVVHHHIALYRHFPLSLISVLQTLSVAAKSYHNKTSKPTQNDLVLKKRVQFYYFRIFEQKVLRKRSFCLLFSFEMENYNFFFMRIENYNFGYKTYNVECFSLLS